MKQVYLDYAATTPTDPEVVKEMLPYFTDIFGNPSSIYAAGQEAKEAVEKARSRVARLIGARDEEIVFTSGGTEADNAALEGIAFANESKGNHIITTAIEHHAVTETCEFLKKRGFKITYLKVDKCGLIDPGTLRKAITDKTILVSIMQANNEIGTIEPITELAAVARERGIYFHTDAVQTVGHIPVDVKELGVDMLSMSGHKLQGPKGVGALYLRKGTRIIPFMHGGAQENRKRATTENVPGIVGFGYAAELASENLDGEAVRLTGLRDQLIRGLQKSMDHIQLNGHPTRRLPNNVNVSVEYVEGESMLLNLDLEGISASSGSACTSGSLDPSHVLLACGLPPEQAHGSLRLTLGKWTVEEDIDRVLDVLPGIVAKLRAMSPLLKSHS